MFKSIITWFTGTNNSVIDHPETIDDFDDKIYIKI